ncbi:hypothetical protein GOODEAATRI_007720 [Goodea atripinnis]|uniref:Uncharacterized protein n=1 Tax=Goodea atripinnis TaxID=208336 RepID=A0ABV0PC94_9TELE
MDFRWKALKAVKKKKRKPYWCLRHYQYHDSCCFPLVGEENVPPVVNSPLSRCATTLHLLRPACSLTFVCLDAHQITQLMRRFRPGPPLMYAQLDESSIQECVFSCLDVCLVAGKYAS